ncbi:MAG TPA: hypothetical protein VE861_15540, partial [Gemmatimonadaceae bacterium]|nr:hypothetical protein [Gemmatimonadaceae bacterium]
MERIRPGIDRRFHTRCRRAGQIVERSLSARDATGNQNGPPMMDGPFDTTHRMRQFNRSSSTGRRRIR